jgi:AraC family transcriptional regulator, regulatory protein of adaptative response / methylated-DNA-[protein]-cysteine methyltransferase
MMLSVQSQSDLCLVPEKVPTPEQNSAWQAVLERDRRYDGLFVYAVRSTGIYCRPSCPSRRPRPEMVEFFEQPKAAESAGYRSCRRCRPTENGLQAALPQAITRVARFLDEATEEIPKLEQMAGLVNMSPFHLQRTFKQALGISPREYAELRRFLRFRIRLQNGDDVTTAMYEAGFQSPSRLYERSRSVLGMTPSTYKAGGAGMKVGYTIASTSLGRVLVAQTDKGVCAVRIGDSDKMLEAELRNEFANAEISRSGEKLSRVVKQVVSAAEGHGVSADIPLDIRHTAFQGKVWQALRSIRPGETRSYAEIAKAVGDPKAVRAVARACATNPVALVIPCHRVVRSDGELSGYRWGAERKRKLLESEKRWK